jgi:hypothetical protein
MQDRDMRLAAKVIVSALVFLAVYFFSYWAVFVQVVPDSLPNVQAIAALLAGAACAFLMWRTMSAADQGIFATAASRAAVAGAIGFCGGFFGPLILTPGANQGPLLGIFITGPLAFIGGGIGGLIFAFWKRSRGAALS